MEIRENDKLCIFTPLSKSLDKRECLRLFLNIESESRQVGIDLANVEFCSIDFIENLQKTALKKQLGIFNIPSDIFVLFNIMKIDKTVKLYVNEADFKENSRQLLNRNFSIIF